MTRELHTPWSRAWHPTGPRIGMPLVLTPTPHPTPGPFRWVAGAGSCNAGLLGPGRTVPSAPCGRRRTGAWELASADRYFQSGRRRGGWAALAVGRGRRAGGPELRGSPGWGVGGGVRLPSQAPRSAPRLSPAERGRRGLAGGEAREDGGPDPGIRGLRGGSPSPAGARSTELRQGATRARGRASRPSETTTPRPLGGRGRPAPPVGPLGGGRDPAVSLATRALGRRAGGGPAPYCVAAGAGPRGAGQVRAGALGGRDGRRRGSRVPGEPRRRGLGKQN